MVDDRGIVVRFRAASRFYLLSEMSSPDLGPTQWVSEAFWGAKMKDPLKTDLSPPSTDEFNNKWRYTPTPPLAPHDPMTCTG